MLLSNCRSQVSKEDIRVWIFICNVPMPISCSFRFLKVAVAEYDARLCCFEGGSLRNAIPREAFSAVTVPADGADDLLELVAEYENTFPN